MTKIEIHSSPGRSSEWWKRIAVLRYIPPLVKLVWQTHRGLVLTMLALRLLLAMSPVATLWVTKLIVDTVVEAVRTPSAGLGKLWWLVALEIAIALANEALTRASLLV